jgi:hypothetical protein
MLGLEDRRASGRFPALLERAELGTEAERVGPVASGTVRGQRFKPDAGAGEDDRDLEAATGVHGQRVLSAGAGPESVQLASVRGEELAGAPARTRGEESVPSVPAELHVRTGGGDTDELLRRDPRLGEAAEAAVRPAREPEPPDEVEVER